MRNQQKTRVENKSNEATALRPHGDRILCAPLVEIDLNNFMAQLKQEITWTESDRNSITVFKSDHMTIVLIAMHANAQLKKHSAKGNLIIQVLDGKISFTADQQLVLLEKGQMVVLEANIPHTLVAIKESFFLLTMMINDRQ